MPKTPDPDAQKFPETLFVTRDTDHLGDTIGLTAHDAVEAVDESQHGNLVAIYRLERIERLTVTKTLGGRGSDTR